MISVVVPCFNEKPERLSATLESIRSVLGAACSVIVVDDGSDVPVEQHDVGDARLIRLHKNAGPAAALNAGYEAATTPYVSRCDVGDTFLPGFAVMADIVVSHHAGLAVFGRAIDGNTGKRWTLRPSWAGCIYRDGQFPLSGSIVARQAWADVKFDESLRFADDWDWQARIQKRFGWNHIDLDVCVATCHPDGHSASDGSRKRADRQRVAKKLRGLS